MSDQNDRTMLTMAQALEMADELGKQAKQLHRESTHWRVVAAVLVKRAGGTITVTEQEIDGVSKMQVEEHLLRGQEGGNGDGDRLQVQVKKIREDIGSDVVRAPKIQAEVSALDLLQSPGFFEEDDDDQA